MEGTAPHLIQDYLRRDRGDTGGDRDTLGEDVVVQRLDLRIRLGELTRGHACSSLSAPEMSLYARVRGTRRRWATRTRRRNRRPVSRATARRTARATRPIMSAVAFAPATYVVEARGWASQVHSHEPGERTARAAGSSAMLGLVNRSTTPSRSIRQTIASTARGRQ